MILFASVLHEYIHKWTATSLGYYGYFTWGRPFLKYLKNPGLKLENIKYNKICAKDMIVVRIAAIISIPFFGIGFYILAPNWISFIVGWIVGFLASGIDIYDAYKIKKHWL